MKILKVILMLIMFVSTVAVGIAGDETYYDERYDYFDFTILSDDLIPEVTNSSNISGELNIRTMLATDNYIFAGTGDGDIYRSTDGINWSLNVLSGQTEITDMIELDSGRILASTALNKEVCYTDNEGTSWTCVDASGGGVSIDTMAVIGTYIYGGGDEDKKLKYSTDSGATWGGCGDIPSGSDTYALETVGAYIWTGSENSADIYKTSADCTTFTLVNDVDTETSVTYILNASNGCVYVGTAPNGKVFETCDDGATMTDQGVVTSGASINVLAEADNILYAGLDNGELWRSFDYADSWVKIDGINENTVYDLAENPTKTSCYIGTGNSGNIFLVTPLQSSTLIELYGDCGEYVDYNNDGKLDLVGFKTNISTPDTLWNVLENIGSNENPRFSIVYNFTYSIMGGTQYGGECVATGDLDNDGDLDFFTYKARIQDTPASELYLDSYNKSGYRSMWRNDPIDGKINLIRDAGLLHTAPYAWDKFASGAQANILQYINNYPTSMRLMGSICDACPADTCDDDTGCFGQYEWTTHLKYPDVYYQFIDADYDGDLDVWVSHENGFNYWFENEGSSKSGYWVQNLLEFWPVGWGGSDNTRVVDFDSDGDMDYLGSDIGALAGNRLIRLSESLGWIGNESREEIINTTNPLTASVPFGTDVNIEPVGYGNSNRIIYAGDMDSDNDIDIITVEQFAGTTRYVLYQSKDIGNASGFFWQTVGCDWPCIYQDDFDDYNNGYRIDSLNYWDASDCMTVENGVLVFDGSCSTSRNCLNIPETLKDDGTINFNIKADENCRFSTYNTNFNQMSILNSWDNYSGNQVYHYFGDYLSREILTGHDPERFNSYSVQISITNESYSLSYIDFDGTKSFYDGGELITGVNKICFNAVDSDSVCSVDDILITASPLQIQTEINSTTECFMGWCWDKTGVIGDSRPSNYVQQRDQLDTTFYFNYDLCIEAGYSPNMMCPIKLAWSDGKTSVKNFFIDNIVILVILIIILLALAIVMGRGRSEN